MKGSRRILNLFAAFNAVLFVASLALAADATLLTSAFAASDAAVGEVRGVGLAMIGNAVAEGAGTIGAAIAVGYTGAAALAAMSENPGVLAEGIAMYGLAVIILSRT